MRAFIDLKDSPNYNPEVTNGIDSISRGVVFTKYVYGIPFPYHIKYGALLKVSDYGIWRCPQSNEGCFEIQIPDEGIYSI